VIAKQRQTRSCRREAHQTSNLFWYLVYAPSRCGLEPGEVRSPLERHGSINANRQANKHRKSVINTRVVSWFQGKAKSQWPHMWEKRNMASFHPSNRHSMRGRATWRFAHLLLRNRKCVHAWVAASDKDIELSSLPNVPPRFRAS
jgi:hypothetical protein